MECGIGFLEELEEKVQAQACKKACMTEAKKDLRC